MTMRSLRHVLLALLAVLAGLAVTTPSPACPFCGMTGQTLTDDVNQASMVLYGTLTNPQINPNGDFGGGSTDMEIAAIVKKHEIIGDKKKITLPRYVPVDKDSKVKFLIFCDVFKGKIDPYKGVPVKTDDIVKYLTGAIELKGKEQPTRLKFFFNWLDNADIEISNDAYKEFGNADYKDYKDVAKEFPADKVAKWLQDSNTPAFRYGLYGSLLGHCGKPEQAAILRKMLDDPAKRLSSGVDGILAGYIMLKPLEGWDYTRKVMADPYGRAVARGMNLVVGGPGAAALKENSKDFMLRYAGLRTARFFWEYRSDVIDRKQVLNTICLLLDQSDIADLAIEDLRKWKATDVTDRVLALMNRPSHNIPIVKRSILRYALSFPDQPKAAAFVSAMRQKDPDWVKDVEELLKLEGTGNTTTTPAPKKQ